MKNKEMPKLAEGETYVGCIGDADGNLHHVILLPVDNDNAPGKRSLNGPRASAVTCQAGSSKPCFLPITATSSRMTGTGATRFTTPSPAGLGFRASAAATSAASSAASSSAPEPYVA